jgi:hypothetical protein
MATVDLNGLSEVLGLIIRIFGVQRKELRKDRKYFFIDEYIDTTNGTQTGHKRAANIVVGFVKSVFFLVTLKMQELILV